jgi:hypothetical protein
MKEIIMPAVKKASVREKEYNNIIVTDKVRSYANEPFFLKKKKKLKNLCVNTRYQSI